MERFKVLSTLGEGSSGVAVLVQEKATGTQYVMKQIPLGGIDQVTRQRVSREVEVLRGINHPNVVKFKTSFAHDRMCNIVMEKCGATLDEMIESRCGVPFSADVMLEWFPELLAAVAHLHRKKIIHRDIKTSNIFLSSKNHLKIGDFGVCKTSSSADHLCGQSMVGTPYYLAPEVCEGSTYNEKSDVWSLGVVFYELLALKRPFDGANVLAVGRRIMTEPPAPIDTDLDHRFVELVGQMLKKSPSERPSAQQLLNQFFHLPESHPSHPAHNPDHSRLVQESAGPTVEPPTPEMIRKREEHLAREAAKLQHTNSHNSLKGSVGNDDIWTSGFDDTSDTFNFERVTSLNDFGEKSVKEKEAPSGRGAVRSSTALRSQGSIHRAAATSSDGSRDSPPRSRAAPASAAARGGGSEVRVHVGGRRNVGSAKPVAEKRVIPAAVAPPPTAAAVAAAARGGGKSAPRGGASPSKAKQRQSLEALLASSVSSRHAVDAMSPEEHTASLQRIRNTKSRLNLAEVRRDMMKKKAAAAASPDGAADADVDVVLVPRAVTSPKLHMDGTPSPQRHVDPTPERLRRDSTGGDDYDYDDAQCAAHPPVHAPPPPAAGEERSLTSPTAFAAAVAPGGGGGGGRDSSKAIAFSQWLASLGDDVTLTDVDEMAEALNAYKVKRFGYF